MHLLDVIFWLFFAGTAGFIAWTFLQLLLSGREDRRRPARGSASLMGAAGAADSPVDTGLGFSQGDAGSSGDSGGGDASGGESGGDSSGSGSSSSGGGDYGGGGGSGGW